MGKHREGITVADAFLRASARKLPDRPATLGVFAVEKRAAPWTPDAGLRRAEGSVRIFLMKVSGLSAAAALRHALGRLAEGSLKAVVIGVEVYSDLFPGLRMRGPRRLPKNFQAGILGAEAATWSAISPSLLPRPWWVTALNVAICQAVGHAAATGIRFVAIHGLRGLRMRPRRRSHQALHTTMSSPGANSLLQ